MTEQEFEQAVVRIRGGDKDGLKEIYLAYVRFIYAVIYEILQNKENTEDVTSEFFIKLWNVAERYEPGHGHRGYLATIARNMAIDFIRKHRREVLRADIDLGGSGIGDGAGGGGIFDAQDSGSYGEGNVAQERDNGFYGAENVAQGQDDGFYDIESASRVRDSGTPDSAGSTGGSVHSHAGGRSPGTAPGGGAFRNPVEDEVIGNIALEEALARLKDGERQIINMKILGDMTFQEISDTLHMPMGTVTWKYRNAIGKLRRCGYEQGFETGI